MRINGRTWPAWALAIATLWFVAITVFWATRSLTDRVPTTVAATAVVGQPPPPPGARTGGPAIAIECGTPSESRVTDAAANQAKLAALRNSATGLPLPDPQFARSACASFHHQSRLLWFGDIGLYLVAVAGIATVMVRRRRLHHVTSNLAAA